MAGAVYRDRIAAADDEDAFTFSVVEGPPGLSIDAASGLLFWHSAVTDAGPHAITVRATDDRGLWTDQPFTLQLLADAQPPDVSVWLSDDLIQLATTPSVVVQVLAVDNVAVTAVTLSLNGIPLPPDAWRRYEFSPPGPGLYRFTATAADAAGNVGTATRTLRVFDPADTTPPVVELTSPAGGDVLTYLTDVIGTVTDENLEFYRLQYALAGTEQWTTFHDSAAPSRHRSSPAAASSTACSASSTPRCCNATTTTCASWPRTSTARPPSSNWASPSASKPKPSWATSAWTSPT